LVDSVWYESMENGPASPSPEQQRAYSTNGLHQRHAVLGRWRRREVEEARALRRLPVPRCLSLSLSNGCHRLERSSRPTLGLEVQPSMGSLPLWSNMMTHMGIARRRLAADPRGRGRVGAQGQVRAVRCTRRLGLSPLLPRYGTARSLPHLAASLEASGAHRSEQREAQARELL